MKPWTCFIRAQVSLQFSEPYKRTDFTLELNICILVFIGSALHLHTGRALQMLVVLSEICSAVLTF